MNTCSCMSVGPSRLVSTGPRTVSTSAIAVAPRWTRSGLDAGVAQLADALDVTREHVAGVKEPRRRSGVADTRRRAGEDQVPRPQRDDVGQAAHELRHREDEVGRPCLLDLLAV